MDIPEEKHAGIIAKLAEARRDIRVALRMAPFAGFEPAAFGFGDHCSARLN